MKVIELSTLTKSSKNETLKVGSFFNQYNIKNFTECQPNEKGLFSMYLENQWYSLKPKDRIFTENPKANLDVTFLSEKILSPILGIEDLRKDTRIDFVGGIRGLNELERRVDSKEMKVAFALFPVSMDELISIADAGEIMPPKTTWFEPKLRSGLFIHELE